jgi:NitT/TauT family transport system substrate-binding protein
MQRRSFLRAAAAAPILAAGAPLVRAQQVREVKFTASWLLQSVDAPLFFAREKGYFGRNINLTVERGFGSADSVVKIGTGAYQIGEGDIYSMIEYNSKVAPDKQLIAVAVKYQRSPLAILALKEKGIDSPQKLVGKNIGDVAGSATKRLFPVLAKKVGFDESKVTWTNVEARMREQLLLRGQYDAAGAFTLSALPPLIKQGVTEDKLNILYYTDYGLDLYGNCVITSRQFARENPDTVAAIVRGYTLGMRDTLANPTEALDLATRSVKGDVGWDVEVERIRLQLTMAKLYTHPAERKAFGVGGLDKKRLETGIRQVVEGFGLPNVPAVSDVFDDRFLPPLAERA